MKLTIEQAWKLFLDQNRKCALTGLPLKVSGNDRKINASLDRIDSGKGYELGNVQWVLKAVNIMKNTYPLEVYVSICKRVAEHRAGDQNISTDSMVSCEWNNNAIKRNVK